MKEAIAATIKTAPPLTVSALTFLGIALSDWTYILTVTYTLALFYVLVRDKYWAPWRAKQRDEQR
jgi:hypothetical protein